MKFPSVDISIESRALARPPRRGIREDPGPGRNQLCTAPSDTVAYGVGGH